MMSSVNTSNGIAIAIPKLDPNNKCLDACIGFENTLPKFLNPNYYNNPIKKITKPVYNCLLSLENKVTFPSGNGNKPLQGSIFFDLIYNYRLQTKYYEENNKNNGTKKPFPIAKFIKAKVSDSGEDFSQFVPFLSGAQKENKDVFKFTPFILDGKHDEVITSVTHNIRTKKEDEDMYEDVDGFSEVEPKKVEDEKKGIYYVLGTIKGNDSKVHEFVDGKIYKVTVTVKYKDSNKGEDKFTYLMDYKATKGNESALPEFLSVENNSYDSDSSLFGVPLHFAATEQVNIGEYLNVKDLVLNPAQ